jgi:hypothetical protein
MSDVVPSRPTPVLSQEKMYSIEPKKASVDFAAQKSIMSLGILRSSDDMPYFYRSTYTSPQKMMTQAQSVPQAIERPTLHKIQKPISQPLQPQPIVRVQIQPVQPQLQPIQQPVQRPVQQTIQQPIPQLIRQILPELKTLPIKNFSQTRRSKIAHVGDRKHRVSFLQTVKRKFGSSYFAFVSMIAPVFQKKFAYVAIACAVIGIVSFGSMAVFSRGMKMKGTVLGVSQDGYASLNAAAKNIKDRRFDQSAVDFEKAAQSFSDAEQSFDEWNETLVNLSYFFPVVSKLSSGKNAVEAGKHIALAGQKINDALSVLSVVKNPLDTSAHVSLLEVFRETQKSVSQTQSELILAQEALDKVKVDDLPEDKRDRFVQVKTKLPIMIDMMRSFSDSNAVLSDLLGGNGPRKYLFLFQNNHEMRATGGFIGSYGLLDITNGRVRNFFVDGIFNPDGQFKENIVPPKPVQKMSAAWSLHDSNWFPDFPMSAEKAISFYEKTGGPTVDGVITLTPTVMQKLLRVTGPIYMEDYGKTLDADNFIEEVQQEVEVDYDKTVNKPKQILSDLAPMLLDRLFNVSDAKQALATAQAFEEGLGEKHILLYSRNADVEQIIDDAGWSGKILDAQKDYLSVINTNINGYKTDGVIDESIEHTASIQDDGAVIDTVTITRKHNGGHEDKAWWNKVNADYMRVYVPKGSTLISAEGHTREVVESPLDYDALGFRRDADIDREEQSIVVDPSTGTRVYDESGKTVFGNWVYVSPQETVTVTYQYLLPFKVMPSLEGKDGFDSYSLTLEKQSGSFGSHLVSSLIFPSQMNPVWQSPENLLPYDDGLLATRHGLRFEGDLKRDRFMGVVFGK